MAFFPKRLIRPELLDHAAPDDARRNLADIIRLNRNFGGHAVLGKLLASAIGGDEEFTLLDVGAASGDSARMIQELYPRASVINLDCHQRNLEAAPQPKVVADAFRLPFSDGSFDYVLACLFLHHFENEEVTALLKSFYALARKALLISDLERHIVPYCFLPATKRLFRWQPMTIHDGVVSVRAAFRAEELAQLASKAGIVEVQVEEHRPAYRLSLVAKK